MPTKAKKTAAAGSSRVPKGKKQMLVIMDEALIKEVKIAAIQEGKKMSHAVEEAVREWLAKRKTKHG